MQHSIILRKISVVFCSISNYTSNSLTYNIINCTNGIEKSSKLVKLSGITADGSAVCGENYLQNGISRTRGDSSIEKLGLSKGGNER